MLVLWNDRHIEVAREGNFRRKYIRWIMDYQSAEHHIGQHSYLPANT
jgi:hypothetical protein